MTDATVKPARAEAAEAAPAQAPGLVLACLVVGGVVAVDPWGLAPFGPLRFGLIGVLLLVCAALLAGRRIAVASIPTVAWVGLLAWTGVAAAWAVDPLHAWIGTPDRRMGWLSWALLALAFLLGQAAADPRTTRLLTRAAALACAALGLYAVAELAGVAPVAQAFASGRLGGPYGQPAYLGAAGALLTPIAVGLAADAGERVGWRCLGLVAGALGGLAVLGSQTRGAWVGLAAAGVVVGGIRAWPTLRRRPARVVVVLVLLAASATLTPLGPRALSIADAGPDGAGGRLAEWEVATAAIRQRPLLGAGPEGYRVVFPEAVDATYVAAFGRDVITDRAHSGVLDVAVAAGLPAAGAYLVLLGAVSLAALRVVRRGPPVLVGAGAGVIAYAVQQQLLFPVLEVDPAFWLVAGLVVGSVGVPRGRRRVRLPSSLGPSFAGAAAVVLLVAGLDMAADHALGRATSDHDPISQITALRHADRAAALRPDSIRAWYVAARVAADGPALTDLDAGLDRIEAGLERAPTDPALRAEHGVLLLERAQRSGLAGDVDRAVESLQTLVAEDPVHPHHRLRLGAALTLADDAAGAAAQRASADQLLAGENP